MSIQYFEQQTAVVDSREKLHNVIQDTLLLLPPGQQTANCVGRAALPFLDLNPVL